MSGRIALLFSLVLAAACGVKGPPLPPVNELEADAREDFRAERPAPTPSPSPTPR